MSRQLPTARVNKATYFVDRRLLQIRNVNDPCDEIAFKDESEMEDWLRENAETPATHYLIHVVFDVSPELHGPFPSTALRDQEARRIHEEDPARLDGIFQLDIREDGTPEVNSYSGAFFDEES